MCVCEVMYVFGGGFICEGRGNLKQDNWGEHAVTCQRCHTEDVTFVRRG